MNVRRLMGVSVRSIEAKRVSLRLSRARDAFSVKHYYRVMS